MCVCIYLFSNCNIKNIKIIKCCVELYKSFLKMYVNKIVLLWTDMVVYSIFLMMFFES